MAIEGLAFFSTAIAIGCGTGLVLFCKRGLGLDGSALLVAVLFAPTVFYLGFSGRLTEFQGLGIQAKFQQVAAKVVVPSSLTPVEPSAATLNQLSEAKALLGMGSAVVLLTVPVAEQAVSHQRVLDVAVQIYPGLLQGKFEMLVVLDHRGKVLSYFPHEFFLDLLRIEIEQSIRGSRRQYDSERVRSQLEQTQLWDIVENPKMRADSWGLKLFISTTDSNVEVLRKLTSSSQSAAVIVNAAGVYSGIVRRDDIIGELLGALASASLPSSK